MEQESIASAHVSIHVGDLSQPGEAAKLMRDRPDVIFHLAGVVSGRGGIQFRTRLQCQFWTARECSFTPSTTPGIVHRVVFSSSIAVFGGPLPGDHPR